MIKRLRAVGIVDALHLLFRGNGCAVDPVTGAQVPDPLSVTRMRTPAKASPKQTAEQTVKTPAEHAARLVAWLQGDVTGSTIVSSDVFGGDILARDVERQYVEMLAELGWGRHPWRLVGRELALRLSGGKKTLAWTNDSEGRKHRLRVYRIPTPRPALVARVTTRPTPSSEAENERIAA